MSTSELKLTVKVTLTPEQLARQWCEMNSVHHLRFFAEIKNIADAEWSAPNALEMQAYFVEQAALNEQEHCVTDDCRKRAKDVIMTLAAPFYRQTLEYVERNR